MLCFGMSLTQEITLNEDALSNVEKTISESNAKMPKYFKASDKSVFKKQFYIQQAKCILCEQAKHTAYCLGARSLAPQGGQRYSRRHKGSLLELLRRL